MTKPIYIELSPALLRWITEGENRWTSATTEDGVTVHVTAKAEGPEELLATPRDEEDADE